MTIDKTETRSSNENQGAVGSLVERGVGRLEPERAKVACKHPRKVVQGFTYGYCWYCPDCNEIHEDWWD